MPVENKGKNLKEEALIKACQRHDRLAQSEFYRMYSAKFLGVAYRFAGDYDVANDLLQEGFIRIFNNIGDYRFEGSFEGWMRRIIVTTSINYIRKYYKMVFDDVESDRVLELSETPVPFNEMNCNEIIEEINRLPAGYRTIMNLYAIESYSYKEISEMLDIKEVSVRSQYMRAKQKLATALQKKNISTYATKIV